MILIATAARNVNVLFNEMRWIDSLAIYLVTGEAAPPFPISVALLPQATMAAAPIDGVSNSDYCADVIQYAHDFIWSSSFPKYSCRLGV